MRYSVVHCVAVRCSALQCIKVTVAAERRALGLPAEVCALHCGVVRCSAWQCVAVCCSVLQCVAVCCSVLQCVVRQTSAVCRFCFAYTFVLRHSTRPYTTKYTCDTTH